MFYDGVLRDHVHHGSDSGPAFLFRLLVLISTLQLHKWYSGQWLQISRLAPKVVLVMFKLVRSMILWDKMGVRNQVPSFKKQKLFSKQVLIILQLLHHPELHFRSDQAEMDGVLVMIQTADVVKGHL